LYKCFFLFQFFSVSDSGVSPDRFPLNWATALYNAIKNVARKQTCGATLLIWRLVSGKKNKIAKFLNKYRLLGIFRHK
jgi:hypothetical protein